MSVNINLKGKNGLMVSDLPKNITGGTHLIDAGYKVMD